MAEYEHVLSVIANMVRVIEMSPSYFARAVETELRNHFLVQLNGQYEGRATGETFNCSGKTDILIREGDRNIFIADCKIWDGERTVTDALNQLVGYLGWRDTNRREDARRRLEAPMLRGRSGKVGRNFLSIPVSSA